MREELRQLRAAFQAQFPEVEPELDELIASLKARQHRAVGDRGRHPRLRARRPSTTRFVELARAVYQTNDRRAALKREINVLLGSQLIEEKSYDAY